MRDNLPDRMIVPLRFHGKKLAVRSAYCTLDGNDKPVALPPRYSTAIVSDALQGFRKDALPHLNRFIVERLSPDDQARYKPAELKRLVARHELVATFLLPLEYGGTLHHRNMALMSAPMAESYHRRIVQQVEQSTNVTGMGTSRHVPVHALPELGKNDYALFVLPQQGRRLALPVQGNAVLLVSQKPPSRYNPAVRRVYRAAAQEAQSREVAKRSERHNINRIMRIGAYETDPS